jgi:hypothetical protein
MTRTVARLEIRISANFRVKVSSPLRIIRGIGTCTKASYARLKRSFELQTLVRGKIMAPLKNRQSLSSAGGWKGRRGRCGRAPRRGVRGRLREVFALLQSFGRSFHAGARIMSYSEGKPDKNVSRGNSFVRSGPETLQARTRRAGLQCGMARKIGSGCQMLGKPQPRPFASTYCCHRERARAD